MGKTIFFFVISFLLAACSGEPVCYYLDATGGNDNNSGLSPNKAWKSLDKLREVTLLPNNKVLLKRGDVFIGELEISAQGLPENRIWIDASSLPFGFENREYGLWSFSAY